MKNNSCPDPDRAIQDGETVYFVEGDGIAATGEFTVKKGKVLDAFVREGRRSRGLQFHLSMEVPGAANPVHIFHPAQEIFTEDEVLELISQPESTLATDSRPIDLLLVDPAAKGELTALLGTAVMSRMLETEIR